MTPKVRKGLGLLALVPLLALADLVLFGIGSWLERWGGSVHWLSFVAMGLGALAVIALVVALVAGLVLTAWGLLLPREDSPTR